jgi:nitroimidazol reductase NimA-like FMN-containing flavoprotein (pyridoxamine 5'-phosphate oxidase superfamily)
VIVFGRAKILSGDAEKQQALQSLVEKYSPDYVQQAQADIQRDWNNVQILEVNIEHMTGKAAIEIVNQ